ncbi:hypothetical protein N752_24775 [Desulforamulus aquiferis]|nr:hypothetical protein N752_24775 [Desulforamulus aquiferis]
MKQLKRVTTILICLVFILTLSVSAAIAEPNAQDNQGPKPAPKSEAGSNAGGVKLETTAETAILIDYASGQILFDKDMHASRPMASVTKLMTMLLICEAESLGKIKMTDKVLTSEHAASMGGSQIFLEPGEELPAKEC